MTDLIERKSFHVLWKNGPVAGNISVNEGRLNLIDIIEGRGEVDGSSFAIYGEENAAIKVELSDVRTQIGPYASIVTIRTEENPFSFFLRDVNKNNPIYIPAYNVAVTADGDDRNYFAIEENNKNIAEKLNTELAEEECYASAISRVVKMHSPSMLGLSRDIRTFSLTMRNSYDPWHTIEPMYHYENLNVPGTDEPLIYQFMFGRGTGCVYDLTKRLDEGALPILHASQQDGGVAYELTGFTWLEDGELCTGSVKGTHYLVAAGFSIGAELTDEQRDFCLTNKDGELNRTDRPVLFLRVIAKNTDPFPRYAFFKLPEPQAHPRIDDGRSYDASTGLACFKNGVPYGAYFADGKPIPSLELVSLLHAGETIQIDCFIPHAGKTDDQSRLADLDFDVSLDRCRQYWTAKLDGAATVSLPEKRISDMMYAGLLQLDITTFGREPEGPCQAAVGKYGAIGSESSPIIQFFDSMGWHDLSRRCLDYFLEKQRNSGQMLNFHGYTIETGAVVWNIAEHFRYTGDTEWLIRIKGKLLRACDYLIRWRRKNMSDDLRGRGFGMLDGKVADDRDNFYFFKNSGFAYQGLKNAAEILKDIDPEKADYLFHEATAFGKDIRETFFNTLAESPVVPLGDGTWCPTTGAWAGMRGPTFLQANGGNWYSHFQFACRDALHGCISLIYNGILRPNEMASDFLVALQQHLYCENNVAYSQPYHSRHDFAHLLRGEVKEFLKLFYCTFSSIADRETYEFWEHYMQACFHKTHEQGWFLMQCRWMLYLERDNDLYLLSGIPARWIVPEKSICLDGVASYFGRMELRVEKRSDSDTVEAAVNVENDLQPLEDIFIRIPHPDGKKPRKVIGGFYDDESGKIAIEHANGIGKIAVFF